ncbi:MAG: hypothetical protein RI897_1979 [Verrucomicrobiota bacterium]
MDGADAGLVFDAFAGVEDDRIAWGESGGDFGFFAVGVSGFDGAEGGAAVFDGEDGPLLAAAEEGAGGDFENVVGFPGDDTGFDAEVIADAGAVLGRGEDIDDDVDALFFDAEGGDFGKGGGFDVAELALEGGAAAPAFEVDCHAGGHGGGVAREAFDDGFEVGGVTDFEDGGSGGDDAGAFLEDPEDCTGDGGGDESGLGIGDWGCVVVGEFGLGLLD